MDKNLVFRFLEEMKLAIFREERMNNNNFANPIIDPNLSPFFHLRKILGEKNCISYDMLETREDKNDFIILCILDIHPLNFKKYKNMILSYPKNTKYLIMLEPFVVNPFQYFKPFHIFFHRIYTRNDALVDNKKYYKFIWPQSSFGYETKAKDRKHKKDIILINGNKWSPLPKELYSMREKIIRFFEGQT
jgi:hypothetical protein